MQNYILIAIILLCIIAFIISLMKHKFEIIVNFILRIVSGVVGIYFLNIVLTKNGFDVSVGINALSILSVGFLGIPGFLLNYAVAFYYMYMG